MNNSKQLLTVARHFSKSTSASEAVNTKIKALKEAQKKFGVDDGTLVHVKGGMGDKILYQFTVGLTAVGMGLALDTFYKITFK